MIQKAKSLNLNELVDLYQGQELQKSAQEKSNLLLLILTHDEIKPCLKNQSQLVKRAFTYSHLVKLIEFLKQQNPEHAELLKNHKFDPSGSDIHLYLKLPFMAMQILCCQCHHINDMLFGDCGQNHPPLLPKLMQFLDHPQHYHLACYFSKVISAITKRVTAPSHKYNPLLVKCIFGQEEGQKGGLFKSIKHFYSLTTLDYVMKWLLVGTQEKVQIEQDLGMTEKMVTTFKKPLKMKFLQEVLNVVNTNSMDQEVIVNVAALFEQMLSNPSKAKKIPALSFKSFGTIAQQPKVTLYDLAAQQEVICEVLQVPDEGCLTLAKLSLIKVFLSRYILELQIMKKEKVEEQDQERKLLQIIGSDNLMYLFEWMMEHLKIYMKMTTRDISSENSAHIQDQTIQNSKIILNSGDKMMILQLLELVRIIHGLQSCKIQLVEYYNSHSSTLVTLIKRLMGLQNNLIHLQTSKIVLSLIRPEDKVFNTTIPFDFARKLLLHAIIELIEVDGVKAHVIEWADLLLSQETQHIFQDYQEEFEWDHIREIVEEAKQIHVGDFRMIQGNIDCFYSEEKAKVQYSHFLEEFTAEIVYEDKGKFVGEKKLSKPLIKENNQKKIYSEDGVSKESVYFFSASENYLKFDVNDLIEDL